VQSRAAAALASALAEADRLRALVGALASNPTPAAMAQRATAEAELAAATAAAGEARSYYDKCVGRAWGGAGACMGLCGVCFRLPGASRD
jgi:hypothetical protein